MIIERQGKTLTESALNTFLYTGDVHYIPLSNASDWQIALDGIKVDGESIEMGPQTATPPDVTLRIPAPVIWMEESLANLTMAKIPGSNYTVNSAYGGAVNETLYYVPCDTNSTLTFTLGGKDYPVPPSLWIRPDPIPRAENGDRCWAAVAPVKAEVMGTSEVTLGLPFLSSVYTVLNFAEENAKIGFAQLSDAARSVTAERVVDNPGANPTATIPGYSLHPLITESSVTSGATALTASWLLVSIATFLALL